MNIAIKCVLEGIFVHSIEIKQMTNGKIINKLNSVNNHRSERERNVNNKLIEGNSVFRIDNKTLL